MAARIEDRQEPILIVSDSDEDDPLGNFKGNVTVRDLEASTWSESSAQVQWVPSCAHGVPGCGNAHALSGHEEHMIRAGHGRPAFAPGHTVGVSTPLGHREEERVRPGAAHPTSGDAPLSSHVLKRCVAYDEPSTSQSASGLTQDIGTGEECLDFDEVNDSEVLVGGLHRGLGGQGNNKSQSFGVLQDQRKAAVRSDRQGGERMLFCSSGNLPRGEERPFNSGVKGRGVVELRSSVGSAMVKDMGVQTSSLDKDVVSSTVGESEVSVPPASSGKAEPERLAQNQDHGRCVKKEEEQERAYLFNNEMDTD
ncbi:hypothetical protein NDU88_003014 [Pleurodeles waltl]|uniref:Uncharacterized protein n=1 Tax=Pleurodeles waltl TaxID=8319 RepID=A0AAV7NK88_PLEWA|nr:hypothetical protein NDU88_003014 [Pleurodeles waltl]